MNRHAAGDHIRSYVGAAAEVCKSCTSTAALNGTCRYPVAKVALPGEGGRGAGKGGGAKGGMALLQSGIYHAFATSAFAEPRPGRRPAHPLFPLPALPTSLLWACGRAL